MIGSSTELTVPAVAEEEDGSEGLRPRFAACAFPGCLAPGFPSRVSAGGWLRTKAADRLPPFLEELLAGRGARVQAPPEVGHYCSAGEPTGFDQPAAPDHHQPVEGDFREAAGLGREGGKTFDRARRKPFLFPTAKAAAGAGVFASQVGPPPLTRQAGQPLAEDDAPRARRSRAAALPLADGLVTTALTQQTQALTQLVAHLIQNSDGGAEFGAGQGAPGLSFKGQCRGPGREKRLLHRHDNLQDLVRSMTASPL